MGQPLTRRLRQKLRQISGAGKTFGAKYFEHEICSRTHFHLAAQKGEQMRGVGWKVLGQSGPCVAVLRRKAGNLCRRCRRIGGHPAPTPIGKGGGKGLAYRHKFQSMPDQFCRMCFIKRRSRKQRQIHCAPVMAISGQSVCAGFNRSPWCGGLFKHPDPPSAHRQMHGAGQSVVARPNEYSVKVLRHFLPLLTLGYLQMHLILSSVIL